jgi:protein AaeX
VMLAMAWIVTIILRRVAARFGLLRHVWHPALFVLCIFIMVLSAITLTIGG